VNGGLGGAASGTSVSGTTSIETMSGASACAGVKRCRTGLDPGRRENVVQRSFRRQKRWSGRGTGAVKATGSYEGSLSVEDISGCHEPSPFTRRWSRRPWRLPHAGKRKSSQGQKLEGSAKAHRRFRGSRERRQRCQRLDRNGRRGERTPTLESSRVARRERFKRQGSVCPAAIRRSVHECREALGTLVTRTEPKTPREVHAAKAAERAGNARGTGVRSIIQVAEVGRTHRAPCPPEDRKVLWWKH